MPKEMIVALLTSSAVATIVGRLINFISSSLHSRKIDRMILLYIIKEMCTDALFNGYISSEDLQCLEEMLAEYKRLGGNGYADTIMNKVRELPISDVPLKREEE